MNSNASMERTAQSNVACDVVDALTRMKVEFDGDVIVELYVTIYNSLVENNLVVAPF